MTTARERAESILLSTGDEDLSMQDKLSRVEAEVQGYGMECALARSREARRAESVLETERDRLRASLERIANADLARCSAGWLSDVARAALEGKP